MLLCEAMQSDELEERAEVGSYCIDRIRFIRVKIEIELDGSSIFLFVSIRYILSVSNDPLILKIGEEANTGNRYFQ